MRNRDNRIVFYLNNDELEFLATQVGKSGLSREAYLRSIIKDRPVKELPSADYFSVLKMLRQISSDLNQLAVQASELGYIDAVEYRRNVELLQDEIGRLIKEAYG